MRISTVEAQVPVAENVTVTEDALSVYLSDGRTISVPLVWFPRLLHGTKKERNNWRLTGKGHGTHWEDLDEDISVENLIFGQASGESQSSFKKVAVIETASLSNRLQRAPLTLRARKGIKG